jgi:hypothetical protein
MPPTGSTHSDDVDSLEPLQRHRGQLIDVPPVAGESSQRATAARQVAGLSGAVSGHVVESDGQRGFFLEDVEVGDGELRLVGLFDEWADFPLGLGGEGDGVIPTDRGRVISSFRRTGESRPEARKLAAVTAEPAIITLARMSCIDFI